jgi:hypothetical protein
MEKRLVSLPNGESLELEFTPAFYDKVRSHFGLSFDVIPDDNYIRMFVWGALQTAMTKAETENVELKSES